MMGPETSTVIHAGATTFYGLTCAGRFEVPWHQRKYDWAPDHVDDLMADLHDAITADRRCYFLGTVILVESPSKGADTVRTWRVNDGQQRLITLSLICARLLRTLVDHDPSRVRLARRVLFDVDEAAAADDVVLSETDGLTPRLTPPRDDRARYRLLLQGQNVRANGKLTAAYRRIDHFVSRLALPESCRFFDFLTGRVELACLSIPEAVDPNAVFETINCRGKPLDDLDLLRNHLYSYFNDEAEVSRRASVHERLERIRAQLRGDSQFTDYARCYFQSRFGFLRRSAFYRETRRHIQSNGRGHGRTPAVYVDDLVADLSRPERVELFRIIASPTRGNPFIEAFAADSGHADDPRNLWTLLRELRDYTVTQPLVFALLLRYVSEPNSERRSRLAVRIHRHLTNLTSFILRTAFVAPKFEPSQVERELSEAARLLAVADRIEAVDIDAFLGRCDAQGVLDDATFRVRMQTTEMRDARKTKRFLFGVDLGLHPDGRLLSESHCTVDHILPKSARHWGGWPGFERAAPETWVHRLGNLTLLHRDDKTPTDVHQRDFAGKQRVYARSTMRLTRRLARYNGWTPSAIARRQRRLAALATRVWSFDRST